MMGTTVPMLPEKIKPEWMDHDNVFLCDQIFKEHYKSCYDQRHNAHDPLPELKPEDSVRIKTDKENCGLLGVPYRRQIPKLDSKL